MDNRESFARVIAEARRVRGLTRSQVAALGGPAPPTLARIEHRSHADAPPRPSTLRKLDQAYGWERGRAARMLHGNRTDAPHSIRVDESQTLTLTVPTMLLAAIVRAADTHVATPTSSTAQDLHAATAQLADLYVADLLQKQHPDSPLRLLADIAAFHNKHGNQPPRG